MNPGHIVELDVDIKVNLKTGNSKAMAQNIAANLKAHAKSIEALIGPDVKIEIDLRDGA